MNAPPPMGNGGTLLREARFTPPTVVFIGECPNRAAIALQVLEARAHAMDLTFTSVATLMRKATAGGELAPTWYFNGRNRNCKNNMCPPHEGYSMPVHVHQFLGGNDMLFQKWPEWL